MNPYLFALGAGLLVGIIYSLLNVRSPAPPVVALVGLLGILLGGQVPPLLKSVIKEGTHPVAWPQHQVRPHMFGDLPTCAPPASEEDRHKPLS